MSGAMRIRVGNRVVPTLDAMITGQVLIETRPFDFGRPDKDKYIDSIILKMLSPEAFERAELFIAYGDRLRDVTSSENVTIRWEKVANIDSPDEVYFLRKTARFFALRILDRFPTRIWSLFGIEWYGVVLGVRR